MERGANFILKVLPYIVVILMLAAACNYVVVNNNIQETKTPSDILDTVTVNTIKPICVNDTLINVNSNLYSVNCKGYKHICYHCKTNDYDSCQHIIKLENLKKYLFDSNTITFLVTLIVVLLVGFITSTQKDIRKEIEKYKKGLQRSQKLIFMLEHFHDMYVRIGSINTESYILKQSLIFNNYILNKEVMEIVYTMYRKARSILFVIREKNINSISENIKWEFVATIDDAVNAINLNKINNVSENTGKTRYIEKLRDELIDLRDLIQNMKIGGIEK